MADEDKQVLGNQHLTLGDSLGYLGLVAAAVFSVVKPSFIVHSACLAFGVFLGGYLTYRSHFVRTWPKRARHIAVAIIWIAASLFWWEQLTPEWRSEHPSRIVVTTTTPAVPATPSAGIPIAPPQTTADSSAKAKRELMLDGTIANRAMANDVVDGLAYQYANQHPDEQVPNRAEFQWISSELRKRGANFSVELKNPSGSQQRHRPNLAGKSPATVSPPTNNCNNTFIGGSFSNNGIAIRNERPDSHDCFFNTEFQHNGIGYVQTSPKDQQQSKSIIPK